MSPTAPSVVSPPVPRCRALVVGLGFVSSTALQVIPCVRRTAGPGEHHALQRLGFGLETRACGVSIGAVGSPAASVGCAAGLSPAEQASSWLEAASSRGSVRLEGGEVWVRWVSPVDFSGCPSCWCCLLPPLWSPAVLLAPSPWEAAEHLQGGSVGSSELRLRKLCLKLSFFLVCLPWEAADGRDSRSFLLTHLQTCPWKRRGSAGLGRRVILHQPSL